MANDPKTGKAEAAETAGPNVAEGEVSHGGQSGEILYGYGRNGGSVADTGTRTDVPVGVEQVESSALSKPSQQTARERQGNPPKGSDDNRGETSTKLGVDQP